MELMEAKYLIKNLLSRVETLDDGSMVLSGKLTSNELEALEVALKALEGGARAPTKMPPLSTRLPDTPEDEHDKQGDIGDSVEGVDTDANTPEIELDTTALELQDAPEDVRLCFDFGTAMSKVTLVNDEDEDFEEIEVLKLGNPGDQEEISESMLISSVYIDIDGLLWFGKMAVDRSLVESEDGSRQRIDNIKRRLSEDGLNEQVGELFNPVDLPITYGDMVLAYLMFLTWAVNASLEELDYPRNLKRRFAMPCFEGEKERETVNQLKSLLGEAQVLADTFYTTLKNGIPLQDFMSAVGKLRSSKNDYPYVSEHITEPLGVAGSIIDWQRSVNSLVMVVDVGAGTSDMGLYRISFNPDTGQSAAIEVEGSSRGITEAGNYLDKLLTEVILKKAGVTYEDPTIKNIRGALALNIREYKETLFNEEEVSATLFNGEVVDIGLDEFMGLPAVKKFGEDLKNTMQDILETVDESFINWVIADPRRRLAVALTGGGAELPMVTNMAEGSLIVNKKEVPVARAQKFPGWLKDDYPDLEDDYPRIAVSLGGARKKLIPKTGTVGITAGDLKEPPKLEGYFQKGQ